MDSTTVLLLGLVALILVVYYSYFFTRSRKLVRKWAEENDYTLLKMEHRLFRKGPYLLTGRNQAVFKVVVRDENGLKQTGWVRCGSWLAGIFGNDVEAQMDESAITRFE
jgi:hypothetical protein